MRLFRSRDIPTSSSASSLPESLLVNILCPILVSHFETSEVYFERSVVQLTELNLETYDALISTQSATSFVLGGVLNEDVVYKHDGKPSKLSLFETAFEVLPLDPSVRFRDMETIRDYSKDNRLELDEFSEDPCPRYSNRKGKRDLVVVLGGFDPDPSVRRRTPWRTWH